MISQMKRLSMPPSLKPKYPVYLRTANNRCFIKLKSDSEVVWIDIVDTELYKTRKTSFMACAEGEFIDVELLINFCFSSSEKEYIAQLKGLIDHYETVKASLNL